MQNIKTTLAGSVAAICQLAQYVYPGVSEICDFASALAIFLMGYFAKDK